MDMQIESAPCQSPAQCEPITEMENGHPNNRQPETRSPCQRQTQCEQNTEMGMEIGHPNNLQPDTLTLLRASPVGLNTWKSAIPTPVHPSGHE